MNGTSLTSSSDCDRIEATICEPFEHGVCDDCLDMSAQYFYCRGEDTFREHCPLIGCGMYRYYSKTTNDPWDNEDLWDNNNDDPWGNDDLLGAFFGASECGADMETLESCQSEHCAASCDEDELSDGLDDLFPEEAPASCSAQGELICNAAVQTTKAVQDCCPECAEIFYDFFTCFLGSIAGAACPADSTACASWEEVSSSPNRVGTIVPSLFLVALGLEWFVYTAF